MTGHGEDGDVTMCHKCTDQVYCSGNTFVSYKFHNNNVLLLILLIAIISLFVFVVPGHHWDGNRQSSIRLAWNGFWNENRETCDLHR